MLGKPIITAACAVSLVCASGCLISTSSETYHSGQYVSPGELGGIKVHETTEQRLLDRFGQPTRRRTVDGSPGTEILIYEHRRVKKSRGRVFLLFSGKSRRVTHQAACFEVTDGVVTRYWTEE